MTAYLKPQVGGEYVQTFLISTVSVTLAEFGDKTQLLALILAARYRKPWPICFGIVLATLVNHLAAGALGAWTALWLGAETLRWIVAMSFLAVAVWTLVPDQMDKDEKDEAVRATGQGVMVATAISFFFAEIGDKTQIATAVIAAQYHPLWQVVAGTTTGMLIADVPAVWLGARYAYLIPMRATRIATAVVFATLAVWVLHH